MADRDYSTWNDYPGVGVWERDRYERDRDHDYRGRGYDYAYGRDYGLNRRRQMDDYERGDRRGYWGSPQPYRPRQDRTQEWLLQDASRPHYPRDRSRHWGREEGPYGAHAERSRMYEGRREDEGLVYEGLHIGKGPKNYKRSDESIREEANERLTQHGGVDATNIQVRVEDAEITLEGTVDSRRSKRMAEDALETIFGVSDIHNRLRIQAE